jgi:hypothetical protein
MSGRLPVVFLVDVDYPFELWTTESRGRVTSLPGRHSMRHEKCEYSVKFSLELSSRLGSSFEDRRHSFGFREEVPLRRSKVFEDYV